MLNTLFVIHDSCASLAAKWAPRWLAVRDQLDVVLLQTPVKEGIRLSPVFSPQLLSRMTR
jgi:hypothetical protein